jgi:hypothetical protein
VSQHFVYYELIASRTRKSTPVLLTPTLKAEITWWEMSKKSRYLTNSLWWENTKTKSFSANFQTFMKEQSLKSNRNCKTNRDWLISKWWDFSFWDWWFLFWYFGRLKATFSNNESPNTAKV